MNLKALWFLCVVAGCGLVQVNGKPLGGNSSSSSSSSSSPSSSESTKEASNETKPSQQSSSSVAAKPAAVESRAAQTAEASESGKKVNDIAVPWTPLQQYWFIKDQAKQAYTAMLIADELGDKFSQSARVALIANCWEHSAKDANAAALWAGCGPEVEAFDVNALQKELQKEGISREAREDFVKFANEKISLAKEYGAAVMAEAKTDSGVAAVVAMGKTAREEWKAFASAHAEDLALLAKLEDLVREGKNGLAGDCMAKTQPAMEKVVRATKWRENDTAQMPNYFYVNLTPKTVESHIATAAWASCLTLVSDAGETVWAAAYGTDYEDGQRSFRRWLRRGPRSLTLAKLFDGDFKPKFASRSLDIRTMARLQGGIWIGSKGMGSPTTGKIAKLVKNGDETTIQFDPKSYGCTDWQQTNKFSGWTTAGDPTYEKKCTARGVIDDPKSDVVTATAFTNGLTPGVQVTTELGFPLAAYKGEKFVAALGVKL